MTIKGGKLREMQNNSTEKTSAGAYVLAMYDIRGKQEYIYRSTHIKEIVGGSAVIEDCFKDYLYPAAVAYRNRIQGSDSQAEAIYQYDQGGDEDALEFSVEMFARRMNEGNGQYLGEVVYMGGGNFFVLYKDKETCVEINRIFTRKLMEASFSLKVLCTYLEDVNFADYTGDQRKLYAAHRLNEAKDCPVMPAQALPFTSMDDRTGMPLYREIVTQGGKREKVTRENYLKYKKYEERMATYGAEFRESVLELDRMVTKKGEESLLAVVYIDGNNMGAKVEECTGKTDGSYEQSVKALRRFSAEIQRDYITDRKLGLDEKIDRGEGAKKLRRFVVSAGDEITFICNARDAYRLMKEYLLSLPKGCSSCAGAAIFHSHAPYADAYRIAEECCESGKVKMKAEKLEDACLMDFHYCQSGIGVDLETIREKEVGDVISKPWFVRIADEQVKPDYITMELVEKMVAELNKVARTNVKSLIECARDSEAALNMELRRIQAHSGEKLDFSLGGVLDEEQRRRLIYDIVTVYDLWFR